MDWTPLEMWVLMASSRGSTQKRSDAPTIPDSATVIDCRGKWVAIWFGRSSDLWGIGRSAS